MPLPPPLPPGAFAAGAAGAAAATKHLAMHAAPFLYDLSYGALAAWLFRYLWRNKVPQWAKEDVSFRSLLMSKKKRAQASADEDKDEQQSKALSASERDEKEMANMSSIIQKLNALVQTVQLDDDHPNILQQHAALLAYIQLCAQIKKQELEELDRIKEDNSIVEVTEEDKDEKKTEEVTDETRGWKSRDDLYETSRVLPGTYPSEYHKFCDNPQDSPLLPKLQQALHFATWAYYDEEETLSEKLAHEDYCLLEHSLAPTLPGQVAYYVAMSSASKKQLIVGIRGTSSLEDIITDVCGRSVPLDDRPYYYDDDGGSKRNPTNNEFSDPSRIEVTPAKPTVVLDNGHDPDSQQSLLVEGPQEGVEIRRGSLEHIWVERHKVHSSTTTASSGLPTSERHQQHDDDNQYQPFLYCHEGIMVSAKRLVDTIQQHVEYWCIQRQYQLVLAGHSLGAGVASLTGALLRLRLPELTLPSKREQEGEGQAPPRMHVFCFAPPPVLDRDASMAASSYTTSVVTNADLIPRCSIVNLLILLEILKGVWEELQKQDLAPTGAKSTAAFFKRLAKGTEADFLMTASAVRKLMLESMEKVYSNRETALTEPTVADPESAKSEDETKAQRDDVVSHNLYIPGVVLIAYEPWATSSVTAQTASLPDLSQVINEDAEDSDSEANSIVVDLSAANHWILADPSAPALRYLDLDGTSRLFVDHTTTAYFTTMGLPYEF